MLFLLIIALALVVCVLIVCALVAIPALVVTIPALLLPIAWARVRERSFAGLLIYKKPLIIAGIPFGEPTIWKYESACVVHAIRMWIILTMAGRQVVGCFHPENLLAVAVPGDQNV